MIKAVAFDLDGTITRPFLNFTAIRTEIGVSVGRESLLDQIEALAPGDRERALGVLTEHERRAAVNAELNDGVRELLKRVKADGLSCGVITRNSEVSTRLVLDRLGLEFERVITRDSGLPLKPDPAPVRLLISEWGIEPGELLMVGDFRYDVESGRAAGSLTCLVTNGREVVDDGGADYRVSSPGGVMELLDRLGGGGGGK